MPIVAVALVLTSSVFHVAWNSLVKTSGDPLATSTRAVGLAVLVASPAAAVAWVTGGFPTLSGYGWVIALASGIVSAAFFIPLSAAYRRGALSSVYPVARGTGALLGVLTGTALLGERLGPAGTAGVVLLLGGTLAAAAATASRSTVVPALLTGCTIAGYSTLDRVGVRTGPPWLYAWAIWTVCAISLAAWERLRTATAEEEAGAGLRAGPGAATARAIETSPGRWRALATGLLIMGTYMLVLLAFEVAPLAGVAPLREAATVLAAAWGVLALGERDRAGIRLAAAAAVAAGAILLASGG